MYASTREDEKEASMRRFCVGLSRARGEGIVILKGGGRAKVHELGTEYQKGVSGWMDG